MKRLSDCKPGDTVIRITECNAGRKEKALAVVRVNRVTLTTADPVSGVKTRWNLDNGFEYGAPHYGYMPRIEAWDKDEHPFRVDANRTCALIRQIQAALSPSYLRTPTKTMAEALPDVIRLALKLGIELK